MGAKNCLLTGFVSSKRHNRFAVEVNNTSFKFCRKFFFPIHVQSLYVSYQLLDLTKTESKYLTKDQSMIKHSRLEPVDTRGLQGVEDTWIKKSFHKCQMDQLKTKFKLSLTSNLDSAVWGVRTESIPLRRASGVVYSHRYAKMGVAIIESGFCTEEEPVRLVNGEETELKPMNTITILSIKIIHWLRAILSFQTWWDFRTGREHVLVDNWDRPRPAKVNLHRDQTGNETTRVHQFERKWIVHNGRFSPELSSQDAETQ